MTFEESYKYAVDMAHIFLEEEDGIASSMEGSSGTIFSSEHPIYNLLAANFPSLHLLEHRVQLERIVVNSVRDQQFKRIRDKCLAIIGLTGIEFVEKLETNQIEGIIKNSAVKKGAKSRALRRELRTLFDSQPYLWFCILASSAYINMMVAHSVKGRFKKQLGTAHLPQTAS